MPVFFRGGHKRFCFRATSHFLFAALLSCLLLSIVLLSPVDSCAKIYTWKDTHGKTHLSNRPPPKRYADKPQRNYEEFHTKSETDRDVHRVVDIVETAFRKNDINLLMRVYTISGADTNTAEERIAREAVQHSLELFFDAFGLPGKFTALPPGEVPQQVLQNNNIPNGCVPTYRGFSFPLEGSDATGLVHLTICGSGKDARLVSFNYDLKDPTPEQQQTFADITRETIKQVADQLASQQQTKPLMQSRNTASQPGFASPGTSAQPQPLQNFSGMPGLQQQPGAGTMSMNQLPGAVNPFDLMQAASMFTGVAMLLQVAVSLLFYFFTSLCIYLIARKTDTQGAWLAWVPILQIFPIIQSAGIAWWWGLVFYLAPIPLMFIPLVNIFGMVAWLLALLIFFVIVWMRICERLGMNKWLGLVMFVPLFNIVLLALLAFVSESRVGGVVIKSIVARTVLAYVLTTVILCGALYLYAMPMIESLLALTGNMQNMNMPAMQQQGPVQGGAQKKNFQKTTPQKKPAAAGPAIDLNEAYYEALFKRKPPDFSDDSFEAGRPETCVGPACVLLSTFWDQKDAHVWLKVRLPDIPYMTMYDSSTMKISDVMDTSGKNVYDANSNFETDNFMTLRFMRHSGGYLEAIRDVHLLPGTKENSLKTVSGELNFLFPMNVRNEEFTTNDIGKTKNIAGLQVMLKELQGNTVKIQITGDIDRYVGVNAFDSTGAELKTSGSSSMTSENTKYGSYSFKDTIAVLKVYAAEKILSKSYAVTLKNK